jgi:hypothetical protein
MSRRAAESEWDQRCALFELRDKPRFLWLVRASCASRPVLASSAGNPEGAAWGVFFFHRFLLDEQKKSVRLSGETDGFWRPALKSAKIKTNS